MTDREMNAAVALERGLEACGDCDPCVGGRPDQCAISPLPDYGADLNAMHEAENELSTREADRYGRLLACLTNELGNTSHFVASHATAPQRREAFLRVKGLRKD